MSGHHEWVEEIMAEHDAKKPYAPENGQPLKFKVGDHVIYTNEHGAKFQRRIIGLYQRPNWPCARYAKGGRYLLNNDCYWYPVSESDLRLDEPRVISKPDNDTRRKK